MEGLRPDKFALAKRSEAMKAPVGGFQATERSCAQRKMAEFHSDKFAFAKRSEAMKAPVGLSSDGTVLR